MLKNLRRIAELVSRGVILKRRLPSQFGGDFYSSPLIRVSNIIAEIFTGLIPLCFRWQRSWFIREMWCGTLARMSVFSASPLRDLQGEKDMLSRWSQMRGW